MSKLSRQPQSIAETPVHPGEKTPVTQTVLNEESLKDLTDCCRNTKELMQWLDSLDRRPGLKELDQRLKAMSVDIEALKRNIFFVENGYQRNVLKKNEHYELVAICWRPDQETPIHDHVGSDCAFLIVEGVSTETIYTADEQNLVQENIKREYQPGEVCAADEQDIHKVSNETGGDLINLHVYTPPLSGFQIYEEKP